MVANDETEVVISGIGGYFPKAKNIEEFTNVLFKQESVVDTARWESEVTDKPDLIGIVDQINYFDASYFGIHRQQTVFMDPLTRMALENTFEAIVDSGLNPTSVRGKKIAVIMGSTLSENDSLMFESVENGFGVTGQARTMLANRISYWMNVTGPSYSMDNSWLGGMEALKNGYEAVKSGECEGAIIGAVNLAMNMFPHYLYKSLGFTSNDYKTKCFDEQADGYLRSEGNIILFLQRANTARRHYANILDIDVMYNGIRSGHFSKMNVDSARKFLTNFYQRVGVDPSEVQYMETYGCGIKAMDEFELNVLDSVFNRTENNPLLVGSVKSTIGHSEAAANFMSIVKTVIAMEKCEIPANMCYETPNPKINALKDGRIKVVTKDTPWKGTLAAVNGYGLITSYGHMLLKSNTKPKKQISERQKLPHLYVVSTRTESGMREIIDTIKGQPTLNEEYMNMINDVFCSHISGHLYRGYLVSSEPEKQNEPFHTVDEISHYGGSHRPIWFVYSGMGSQWISMGKDLLRLPIFAAAIAKCHATLEPHGVNLTEIISSASNPDMFNNNIHSFVGIAAIQIGLTDVLHAIGIKPDFMLGHSVGELGCAYADGCLTAEQMILAAYYRGRASIEVDLVPGLMAAVGMGAVKMQELLPPKVDIACRNGPDSCTISGPVDAMRQLVSTLQASGIFARLVDVAGIAYHSRYIKPAAPLLLNYLKNLIPDPKLRSSKWLSSSVPEANKGWESELAQHASAEYLTNNLLSCVYFEEVLTHIPNEAIVIEIAPHGLLQAILKRSLHSSCVNIALTKRGEAKGIECLMTNLGKLYLAGAQLSIRNIYKTDITTKFECCSKNTPSLAPLVRWNHVETWRTGVDEFKDNSNSECTYMLDINSEIFHDLNGHRIYKIGDDAIGEGTITVPITTYLPLICGILSNIKRLTHIVFEDVNLIRHRVIPEGLHIFIPPFRIMAQRGTGLFEVSDRYGLVASGRYSLPHEQDPLIFSSDGSQEKIGRKIDELTGEELYKEFAQRGHNFQNTFKTINKLEIYESGLIANIEWKAGWHMFAAAMLQLSIYREGQFLQEPIDVFHFQSLAYSFSDTTAPTEGSKLEVVYNFATNKIISSIVTIVLPSCRKYQIEPNVIFADKCYFREYKTDAQVNPNKIAVVNVEETSIKIKDLQTELPWAIKLNAYLRNEDLENIYLVLKVLPNRGIDKFLSGMRGLRNGNLVRLIIILDDSAPPFTSISDAFYQPVFRQKHCVALYSSGVWEFRSFVSSRVETRDSRNNFKSVISGRKNLDTNIRFVGINAVNVVPAFTTKTFSSQLQLNVVDYSGIDFKSNTPVMGIASIKGNLSSDPILKWPVPKRWSLIEGATVPFPYTLAFYVLNELVCAQSGETILIHNGCSSIGQAMIRVAHSLGCVIYTSVASEKQQLVLLHHLRMLNPGMIFNYTSSSLEMQIMNITQGNGISILINCLPEEFLKSGLRCISSMGRVVHFVDENQKDDFYTEKIGLGAFLKVTGMYGVSASKILELPDDMKLKLRDQFMTALKKEQIVIPIRREVFREQEKLQMEQIASYLLGTKVTGGVVIPIENLKTSVNTEESSYIVYGGEDLENIITLAHWLVNIYGAKNIVVLSSHTHNTDNKKFLQRNLSIIKSNNPKLNIESLEVPVNKPDKVVQTIQNLKSKIIAGVLILSNGNNRSDQTFIKTLQDKINTHIVLLGCVSNVHLISLERYHTKNIKNVSFLRWDKKRLFCDILRSLTSALEETVDIFVRCDIIDEEDNIVTSFSFEDYCKILSTSIPSFLKWSPVKDISVEQIVSHCPKVMTECPPIFIVPGLFGANCTYLQNAVRSLMSPVYILDGNYSMSLDQLVVRLGEEVRKIYPTAVYNIIGVSTGGALAIELAKHLELDFNANVQLYLVDGRPTTMQKLISEVNDYEIVLLKNVLNIEDPELINVLENAPPNWKARIEAVLHDSPKKHKQIQLLMALKQRLDVVLNYIPSNRMLNGVTRLLKPIEATKENTKFTNLYKHVKVEIIKGNHFTMLQAMKLTDYINNNIIVPKFYE